jgi:hypothetical protein
MRHLHVEDGAEKGRQTLIENQRTLLVVVPKCLYKAIQQ